MTPNQKGAIAEAAIAWQATKLGIGVLKPLGEGERYDLVLDLRPRLLRVQCKWRFGAARSSRYGCRPVAACVTVSFGRPTQSRRSTPSERTARNSTAAISSRYP